MSLSRVVGCSEEMNSRMSEKRECCKVTAVILAGGVGSRLRSAVSDRPKVLAEVNGRPYLEHLFDQLIDADIENAVLCTGHLADMVKKACGSTYGSMKLSYSQEFTPMGTGGALRLATPHIRSDSVLVMNGDSYCTANINDFNWTSSFLFLQKSVPSVHNMSVFPTKGKGTTSSEVAFLQN